MNRRISGFWAALCASAIVLSGCGGEADSAPDESANELRIGMALGDLATLDPARVLADAMQLIIPLYSDTLVDVNQEDPTEIVPALATEWKHSDDLTSYTFTLRDDVTFPSGNTMTAKDVKFSLNRIKNVQGASAFKMGMVESIDVIDPTTVKFNLTHADSSFLSRMTAPYLAILDSKALKAEGGVSDETAVKTDKAQEFLDGTTIGSGPYVLDEWNRNESISFKVNPDYWGEDPTFERIIVQDVREASTQRQLVERGDIDIAMDIAPDMANALEDTEGVRVVKEQSYNINYLAMSITPQIPEFKDVRVRRAVQAAIDYEGISKAFGDGAPRPAAVVPLGFVGSDQVDVIEYDPERAKQLLAESGVTELSFDVEFANATWYGIPQQALWEKLKSDFAAVGININLVPVEYAKWIADFRAQKLPMTSGLWAPEDFDSSSYFDPFGREDGIYGVRTNMDFPEGQVMYEKYLSESDPAVREKLAVEYITKMRDNATLIPIIQPKKIFVHSDAVSNVKYSPDAQIQISAIKINN